MSDILERFYIQDATERGAQLLSENKALQEAMARFVAAEEPHKERVPDIRLLGAGRYGFTFRVAGIALKIATPTSSKDAYEEGRPHPPEDLSLQFMVLAALREHLHGNSEGVLVPEQLFVAHTSADAYLLGQQLMEGWETIASVTDRTFPDTTNPASQEAVKELIIKLRARLERALEGFGLLAQIDDLRLQKPHGLHGANLLVPSGAELNEDVPLCIIDQPGHPRRNRKLRTV